MYRVAGIVTYNPDLIRLKDNVSSIREQVDSLIIVDNGSPIIRLIENEFINDRILFIKNEFNAGIAKALNQMAAKAMDLGAEWLLTLDQDSVVSDNIIDEYIKYTDDPSFGIITCRYIDRNTDDLKSIKQGNIRIIHRCITSGTFMNLRVWKEIGGFYEPLFIDQVDFDYCYSLREHGYRILEIDSTYILHEIGRSSNVSLFGHHHIAFNHSPLRYYYMMRNMIVVAKRHHMWKYYLHVGLRRWLIVNRFENNRMKKNKMMLKGLYHGIVGKMGKLEE